jgi:hypothetical protein
MSKTLSKKAALCKGVLLAVLTPKLAADAMPDLNALLTGVSRKNWLTKKPGIIAALKPAFAADADLEGLVKLLDSLDGEVVADEDDDLSMDDESSKSVSEILDHLRGKISDEDMTVVEGKLKAMAPAAPAKPAAADEPPAFEGKPEVGGGAKPADEDKKDDDTVSRPAMDAAIKVAVKQAEDAAVARVNGIHEAKQIVKPYVGELALACDSAEGMYKAALKLMNVEIKGIHPSAYRSVLEAQPVPGADSGKQRIAQDSSKPSGYADFMKDLGLNA